MWILLALGGAAAFLGRRLNLRDGDGGPTARAIRIAAPVLLVASLAVALAQTIVVSVLGGLASALHTDTVGVTWLLTAFMLASAVATPIGGKLGDLFGYRHVMVGGLVLLVVGSAVSAFAVDHGSYSGTLVGRVIQGLAGGVFPCAFGYAREVLPPARLGSVVPALSAMFGLGGAVGMLAAGPLVDRGGVSAIFWTVVVVAAFTLVLTVVLPTGGERIRRGAVDVVGAVLLAATLVALLLAVSQGRNWGWTSPAVIGLLIGAVVAAALLVVVERRAAEPLIDLRLLVGRDLLAVNAATIVVGAGMFAAVTLIPLFAQSPRQLGYGFGFSASRTGLLILPMAVFMVLATPIAPRVAARFGSRTVFQLGAALAALGLVLLGLWHESPVEVAVGGAILGLAYGLAFGGLGSLVVGASPPEQTGAATGINTILRTVGGAIGTVVAATIVGASAPAPARPPTESGYTWAFLVSALIAVSACLIAAAIPRPDIHEPHV
ncbi:MFS transporter [Gordonia sp. (in: high G+C Gram-positive bacteria)]|uniref:MFS transporter n=1 Tax=Gordonia sp. (in: high G+C Gram-positive bacteria) TaxID=84139 RepID=UPI0039E42340